MAPARRDTLLIRPFHSVTVILQQVVPVFQFPIDPTVCPPKCLEARPG